MSEKVTSKTLALSKPNNTPIIIDEVRVERYFNAALKAKKFTDRYTLDQYTNLSIAWKDFTEDGITQLALLAHNQAIQYMAKIRSEKTTKYESWAIRHITQYETFCAIKDDFMQDENDIALKKDLENFELYYKLALWATVKEPSRLENLLASSYIKEIKDGEYTDKQKAYKLSSLRNLFDDKTFYIDGVNLKVKEFTIYDFILINQQTRDNYWQVVFAYKKYLRLKKMYASLISKIDSEEFEEALTLERGKYFEYGYQASDTAKLAKILGWYRSGRLVFIKRTMKTTQMLDDESDVPLEIEYQCAPPSSASTIDADDEPVTN